MDDVLFFFKQKTAYEERISDWSSDVCSSDLIEWYPNKDSLLSATVYYKQFNGGFQPVVYDETFTINGEQVTVPVTQTRNSPDKSRIYGLELTAATRFKIGRAHV